MASTIEREAPEKTRKALPRKFGKLSSLGIYRAERTDRIDMIRAGLPAIDAQRILAGLDLPKGMAMQALGLSPATFNRKVANKGTLATQESERVLGVAKLIGQVESMVEESGDPAGFDAGKWVSGWLRSAVPALGGRRPIDLLDTIEGQNMVSETLARMQSGAYA